MNEWTRVQEANFQELVRRAAEQSRECYRRRDEGAAVPVREPVPPPRPPEPPALISSPISVPRRVDSSPKGVRSNPIAPARGQGKVSGAQGILGGVNLKGLMEKLDNEGLMLAMLLWLLIEEKADNTVILAIAYILLV